MVFKWLIITSLRSTSYFSPNTNQLNAHKDSQKLVICFPGEPVTTTVQQQFNNWDLQMEAHENNKAQEWDKAN